jgi:hypothetical protein
LTESEHIVKSGPCPRLLTQHRGGMVVLQALASALILPLDRVRERELQNAENAEPTEQAPEPVKPGAVPERPVYPTVGHSLLCVNAVAVGAITATWFWSQVGTPDLLSVSCSLAPALALHRALR